MKEATFTLTLLAVVVALRYAWHRLLAVAAVRAGGDAIFSADAEITGLSRPPLPRFDPAAEPLAVFAFADTTDANGDLTTANSSHGQLRTALLRMATALAGVSPVSKSGPGAHYAHDLVRQWARRTPLPRTGAGEFLRFWRGLMGCPS